MATRSRKTWKPNNKEGVYQRQVGWKLSRNGKRVQHKFRFACALKEAQRREQKIVEVWERIEATTFGRQPQWSDATIEIAKQIAAGKEPIHISKEPDEGEVAYVRRVHDLRKRFPTFSILPELEYGHAFGLRTLEWLEANETLHLGAEGLLQVASSQPTIPVAEARGIPGDPDSHTCAGWGSAAAGDRPGRVHP